MKHPYLGVRKVDNGYITITNLPDRIETIHKNFDELTAYLRIFYDEPTPKPAGNLIRIK